LQAAGLDPVAIEVEPVAAARSLTPMADDGMPAGETIGIINMGAGSTELTVVTGGILVFPRTISIGGDSFTKAIAENLGMRQDAAERHKRQYAVVDLDQMAAESAEPEFGGDSGMPDFSSPAGGPLPPSFEGVASGPGAGPMAATPGLNPFLYGGAGGMQGGPGGSDALGMAPPAEGEGGGGGSIFDLGAPGGDLSDLFSTQVGGGGPFGGGPGGPAIAGLGTGIGSGAGPGGAMTPEEEDAYNVSQVRDCLVPVLGELVTEIRRSLDYYRSQHPELPISRLVLCGGTIRMPNLDRFLENELGVSVERANPLAQLGVNLPTAPPDWLQDVSPVLSVAIGLAERDMVDIPKDYVPRTLAQV
jgi:type IV pilus assembly protein PilM